MFHQLRTPGGRGSTSPVYELSVYADGRAVFEGQRNAARQGRWERQVSTEELNRLRQQFEQANFWNLRNQYTANVMDLGATYISYSLNGRTKQIYDLMNAPSALKRLEASLEALVSSGEWKQPDRRQD